MQLDELGNGNHFADYEVFRNLDVKYNVITTTPSEILTITDYDLKSVIPKEVYEELKEQSTYYPEPERIKKQFFENLMWRNYKSKIILHFNHELLNAHRKEKHRLPYLNRVNLENFQIYDDVSEEIRMNLQTLKEEQKQNLIHLQALNVGEQEGSKETQKTNHGQKRLNYRQQAEQQIMQNLKRHNSSTRELLNKETSQVYIEAMKRSKSQLTNQKKILPRINSRSNVFSIVNQIY